MPEPTAFAARLDRDVVALEGEESGSFLQGQLSQDVLCVAEGRSTWSWVLSPQGKVDALVRVTRLSGGTWLLDTDRGWGPKVAERLNRFKLRTKVTVEALEWSVLGLRGDAASLPPTSRDIADRPVVVDPGWPGVNGVDLIGPDLEVPDGWRLIDAPAQEAVRIDLGIPRMGAELDERTMPGETGLVSRTVSFTKGCYTGQELVARVDSRGGNVPRRLARLEPSGEVEPGSALATADGHTAGVVTSVAATPNGGWVALGYLKRGVDPASKLVSETTGEPVIVKGLVE